MNTNFQNAAKAVSTLNKKGESLWASLVMFCVDIGAIAGEKRDVKPEFKREEACANVEIKVEMGKNSTYRVAKGVLIHAVAEGVAIVDGKGKPRGKTEIEKELALLKEEKSELDKFKSTLSTASKIADKLEVQDRVMAAALVQDLLKQVSDQLQLKLAA